MKLIHKDIDKNGCGTITMIGDGPEDMWHAYNLISVDDQIQSSTIRRVTTENSAGSTSTNRVHTTLTISIKNIHFDTQGGILSLNGTNIEENPYVKMGAYHTIDLEANRKFTIRKREWDSVALDRVYEACDPGQNADLAAIVMQEGMAHLCLVLSAMTLVKAKIETNIARKRKGASSNYDKSMEKFFDRIVQAILTHINFDVVRAIIIASPGTLKDEFFHYMHDYATKNNIRILLDFRSKFVLTHASSGFKHSLSEVLHDPALVHRLNNTKAMSEVKALDAFYAMQKVEPNRAVYGFNHVESANEAHAIDTLLIADSLFRSNILSERKKHVNIVDDVKARHGQVKIFSTMHISGEQLLNLTGIAAILRFPMADIDEHQVTEKTMAAATASSITSSEVNKLASTLTNTSLKESKINSTENSASSKEKEQKKFIKKQDTQASQTNSPAKKPQTPKVSTTTSKKPNKYNNYDDYDDDYNDYDDYDQYDEYDEYYK